MYLTLITLPLLGSIVSGFFGRKVGVVGAHIITCSCVIITTILSFVAFIEVGMNNIPVSINLFRWVDSESLNVLWGFNFDSLTVSMLIPVLVVSSLVHLYSIEYMSHDPHNQRFFSYLSLFTFMMIILVTANNFLLMFVGWEGVGVCSYLLVSFWFTRIAANQSSLAAFLTNRVGDCLLTVGMFAILWSFGNIDYNTVFSTAPFINENIITLIGICLLIGAMAKSSQVGLHIWLPMAMEGPTPVSALIHAATMVTAGVYLLMRTSPLLEYSSTVLICCLWLGALTTVFSSLIGLFQQDIKKVIAYSTMSQLGMMVIAVGLSSYNIALFHLVNHAFYKALLFLGAGAVIHAVADNQDFRRYGGLRQFLPLTYSVMLIASLSLVAFPFMTGFYSKDFILESAFGQFTFSGTAVYYIATIGAMFTTLYSVKVLFLTFLGNPMGTISSYEKSHEGGLFMSLPLIILAVFSIFFGFVTKDIFIGLGSNFFADNSIFIHPNNEIMLDTEFAVSTFYKLLPLFFTVSLTILALVLSEFIPKLLLRFKFSNLGYNIFGFFNQRFLVELFYNKYITSLVFKLGGQTTKVLDKGSVELIGPYGLEKGILNLSKSLSKLDTGVVTTYALYILIGLILNMLITFISISTNLLIILLIYVFNNINFNSVNIDTDTKVLESSVFDILDPLIKFIYEYMFGAFYNEIDSIESINKSSTHKAEKPLWNMITSPLEESEGGVYIKQEPKSPTPTLIPSIEVESDYIKPEPKSPSVGPSSIKVEPKSPSLDPEPSAKRIKLEPKAPSVDPSSVKVEPKSPSVEPKTIKVEPKTIKVEPKVPSRTPSPVSVNLSGIPIDTKTLLNLPSILREDSNWAGNIHNPDGFWIFNPYLPVGLGKETLHAFNHAMSDQELRPYMIKYIQAFKPNAWEREVLLGITHKQCEALNSHFLHDVRPGLGHDMSSEEVAELMSKDPQTDRDLEKLQLFKLVMNFKISELNERYLTSYKDNMDAVPDMNTHEPPKGNTVLEIQKRIVYAEAQRLQFERSNVLAAIEARDDGVVQKYRQGEYTLDKVRDIMNGKRRTALL